MSLHLVIDGYNLIRRSSSLSLLDREDLERGREELIQRLAIYRRARSFSITVVFDGWNQASLSPSQSNQKGIRVVFSRRGQKADRVIAQIAREMGEGAMIVTSDTQLRLEAERHNATVIPSEEFERRLEMVSYMEQKGMEPDDSSKPPGPRRPQKRGPSRRLSKKARKTRRRVERL